MDVQSYAVLASLRISATSVNVYGTVSWVYLLAGTAGLDAGHKNG